MGAAPSRRSEADSRWKGEGFSSRSDKRITENFPVAMRLGDTPVLIPNTMVKT